jgi:hypothetical protein
LAGEGDHTIAGEMEEAAVKGLHRIEVRVSANRTKLFLRSNIGGFKDNRRPEIGSAIQR